MMKRFFHRLVLMAGLSVTFSQALSAQSSIPAGQVDVFMGVDFNYRDIWWRRLYDLLINLTPGVKWNMGEGWQASAQMLVPVLNQYGDRYKNIRLNMATLSKEMYFNDRTAVKVSGGWFSHERYGIDVKGMWGVTDWLALEAQTGLTGHCSMAAGWEASPMERWTGLVGADVYLHSCNTQLRVRGGKYIFSDYGCTVEAMRHFRHCTVGVYGDYSDKGGTNGGFKIVMMLPPYKRTRHKVNFRPASNFRLTYNANADMYANKMYNTDPEENEREGWFSTEAFRWGRNVNQCDFKDRGKGDRR